LLSHYTTGVDVWGIGCIMGEMMLREPLFPGKNYMEQLQLICQVLGKPRTEDLDFVAKDKARNFMQSLPWSPAVDWQQRLPDAPPEAIDLLQRMLVIHPGRRITVDEALYHPFLLPLHRDYGYLITEAAEQVDMWDIHSAPLETECMRQILIQDMVQIRQSRLQHLGALHGSMQPQVPMPMMMGASSSVMAAGTAPHQRPYMFAHPPPEGYAYPSFGDIRYDMHPPDGACPPMVPDDIDDVFSAEY
jgi:serine/threonine protein kinase